jgi:hypothetical protein
MDVFDFPQPDWDDNVPAPCQLSGFARSMSSMGYTPLYLRGTGGSALALVRGDIPLLGSITARANLYAVGADRQLVCEAVTTLKRRGIPTVKVGNTMWGVPWKDPGPNWPFPRTRVIPRHTFVLDLSQDEQTLRRRMEGADRKIRKAENEGVKVREATGPEDIAAYCHLSRETSERVRTRTAFVRFPDALFQTMYHEMAPSGAARFYLAWHEDRPLAGCVFLCSRDTMLYWHGGSVRERAVTAKQAPAAIFWHAIRTAQAERLRWFDFGGCTPTENPSDPAYGVYAFKKRWGGTLQTFYNLEIVLGAPQHFLQERVLAPAWDMLHPLYFALIHRRGGGTP